MSGHCDGPNCPVCAEERARYLDQFEPAPQPPADAAAPAAPTVPGDGDEEVVRETTHQYLQGPWPSDACAEDTADGALCMLTNAEHRFEPLTLREKQAYAAGLERGRALGARDERDACARLASEAANEAEQKAGYYDASAAACDALADAIERNTP